jgi:cell division protein FtsN
MKPRPTLEQLTLRPAGRRRRAAGGVLVGVFIGLVLGLALAAGVAYYFLKGPNPYQAPAAANKEPAREPAKVAKAEPPAAEKPRFDFYRILPGAEEPKPKAPEKVSPDRATVDRAAPEAVDKAGKSGDRFWLQAGSFAGVAEAENLKAQLALSGWEAVVQPATLPDKGLRYRVRIGPYDNTDELNHIKAELARRGFDVAVIKY